LISQYIAQRILLKNVTILVELLIVVFDNKISLCYQHGVTHANPSVNVHLRNPNKQYLILEKFYVTNAQFIGNQGAEFELNLLTQTINTAACAKSPKTLQFQVFVYDVRPEIEAFWGDLVKVAVAIVCLADIGKV